MKHLGSVIVRVLLVTTVVVTGYLVYQSPSFSNQFKSFLSSLSEKASSLNIGNSNLAVTLKQKLVDQQPIIQDSEQTNPSSNVMGTSTSIVTQQAKGFVTSTTKKVMSDLQSLPKEQAADLVRQTCDQIISELER